LKFKDVQCPNDWICKYMKQVRITRVPISKENSKGPTHARWMALQHMKNEDFIFVTDSHSRFRKNWDSYVLKFWRSLNNPYAVLSHYPKGIDNLNRVSHWEDPNRANPPAYGICGVYFEMPPNWMPRNANGCYIYAKHKSPILSPFWCAGFSFMPAQTEKDVPWDPHTSYLFWGEEFSYGSRLFTHGYDVYVPPQDVAFHRYSPDKEHARGTINTLWRFDTGSERDRSEKRVNHLWGVLTLRTPDKSKLDANLKDFHKYGLGKKRSLDAYWLFAGIDITNLKFKVFPPSEIAKGLKRVPWDVPGDPVPRFQVD